MKDLTQAKMFLADERGKHQDQISRTYRTFNSGDFFNEHKLPYGDLYALDDETLAGDGATNTKVQRNSIVILLPIVGTVTYSDSCGNLTRLTAGEMQRIALPKGSEFEVSNPFANDLINYLQFCFDTPDAISSPKPVITAFDLLASKNQPVVVFSTVPVSGHYIKISIGQFDGRKEALYHLKHQANKLFVFVIEGVFEVQGRLLHPRDGLALWNLSEHIDLEALSNEAIILLIEMAGDTPV